MQFSKVLTASVRCIEPELHVHLARYRGGYGEWFVTFRAIARLLRELAEPEMTVSLERAHFGPASQAKRVSKSSAIALNHNSAW